MKLAIIHLVIILILLLGIIILFIIIKSIVSNFLETYFGTRNLKEAIEKSEIEDQNTPKSLASMESLLKPSILKDFPDLNINELKSMGENGILDYFKAINEKDIEVVNNYNDTIKSFVEAKINDIKDKTVTYSNIQDRFKIEIIYVIDASKVDKDKKLLGLNCPNCGAPITSLGSKKCKYCDTGIKDIIRRTWVINSIKSF